MNFFYMIGNLIFSIPQTLANFTHEILEKKEILLLYIYFMTLSNVANIMKYDTYHFWNETTLIIMFTDGFVRGARKITSWLLTRYDTT